MRFAIFLLFASIFLSWAVVVFIQQWALRNNHLDIPNERSSHTVPTPKGGGIAIASITLMFFALWLCMSSYHASYIIYTAIAATIAVVGWVDDQYALPARFRLLFQIALATIFIMATGAITQLEFPKLTFSFGSFFGFNICLFWVVGLTNAYNFMDGIDGLAAVQSIIAGTGWSIICSLEGQLDLAFLAAMLVTTSLGFLALNKPPAHIFMGDVGSTFLGFSFAALPILLFATTTNPRLLVAGGVLLLPFIFDSFFTMLRRVLNGENILAAHRTHLYQRLIKSGFSHLSVTLSYGALSLFSLFWGISYYIGSSEVMLAAIFLSLLQCIVVVALVYRVEIGGSNLSPIFRGVDSERE